MDALKTWYATLEAEFMATLEGLSEDDITGKVIDRGGDFKVPPGVQIHIYREGLLMFYGKASLYLRALNKPFTELWRTWVG